MAVSVLQQPHMDFRELRRALEAAPKGKRLFQAIADEPFANPVAAAYLFLGFITVYVVDEPKRQVKLAAVSDTELYHLSVQGYNFDPSKYRLSLDTDTDNDIVKAIVSGKPQKTTDWKSYTRKSSNPEQARLNQANSGIAFNDVYPLDIPGGGALLFCYFQYEHEIGASQLRFMERYTQLVSEILTARS